MNAAHRRGYRILYVESIGMRPARLSKGDWRRIKGRLAGLRKPLRKVDEGFWVLSPAALPWRRGRMLRKVSDLLVGLQLRISLRRLGIERPILWVYPPGLVGLWRSARPSAVVYFRTDNYTALPDVSVKETVEAERVAVDIADLCVAVARPYLSGALRGARKSLWLPNAVDLTAFQGASSPTETCDVLVVGTLDSWFAAESVEGLAKARPEWRVTLAGPAKVDVSALTSLPNVRYLGTVPFEDVPALMNGAKVCLVAFRAGPIAEGATPGKLFQYLAAGRPVVATASIDPPDDLRPFVDLVEESPAAFVRAVEEAMLRDTPELSDARRRAVASHSWDARLDEIEEALGIGKAQGRRPGCG